MTLEERRDRRKRIVKSLRAGVDPYEIAVDEGLCINYIRDISREFKIPFPRTAYYKLKLIRVIGDLINLRMSCNTIAKAHQADRSWVVKLRKELIEAGVCVESFAYEQRRV